MHSIQKGPLITIVDMKFCESSLEIIFWIADLQMSLNKYMAQLFSSKYADNF